MVYLGTDFVLHVAQGLGPDRYVLCASARPDPQKAPTPISPPAQKATTFPPSDPFEHRATPAGTGSVTTEISLLANVDQREGVKNCGCGCSFSYGRHMRATCLPLLGTVAVKSCWEPRGASNMRGTADCPRLSRHCVSGRNEPDPQ